jgi:hypothetical protein
MKREYCGGRGAFYLVGRGSVRTQTDRRVAGARDMLILLGQNAAEPFSSVRRVGVWAI